MFGRTNIKGGDLRSPDLARLSHFLFLLLADLGITIP